MYAQVIGPGFYYLPPESKADRRILVDAVPPASRQAAGSVPAAVLPNPQVQEEYPKYGWLRGALPAPNDSDCYIVAFLDDCRFKVLGYIDRYGRAFQVGGQVSVPPAEYPAIAFARYLDQPEEGKEYGTVELYSRSGQLTYPANYVGQQDRFTLYGSWFDFSVTGQDLYLDDALARAYLAFVYRPLLYNLSVPNRDLSIVDQVLSRSVQPIDLLSRLVDIMEAAQDDPAQRPPALGRSLAYWLREAGITECQTLPADAANEGLTLQTDTKYGHLYYLQADQDCQLPERTIWKLEGALNRYRLIGDALGEGKLDTTLEECSRQVQNLFINVVDQAPDVSHPKDSNWGHAATEWDVRSGIARGAESLRVPLRFQMEFRFDMEEAEVFFEIVVPDADMMPAVVFRDDLAGTAMPHTPAFAAGNRDIDTTSGWVRQNPAEREKAASDYGKRLGILLAAVAFRQSAHISKVTVKAFSFADEQEASSRKAPQVAYRGTVGRTVFSNHETWLALARSNPSAFFTRVDSAFIEEDSLGGLDVKNPASKSQALLDELIDDLTHADKDDVHREFSPSSVKALGSKDATGMNINYNAEQMFVAHRVADCLVSNPVEEHGFKVLRAVQNSSDDPQVFEACNRVMGQIAQSQLDLSDQNQVVQAFMGSDRFAEAADAAVRMRYKTLMAGGPSGHASAEEADRANQQAMDTLRTVVDEVQLAGVFQDSDTTVYRVFDSSASRVIYNALRAGNILVEGLDLSADEGKQVELAPDGYYYCCLELLKLMEQSFGHHEDALRYGRLCLRMAPTMAAGYRQLARAYMLGGDLPSARQTLIVALRFVAMPEDVALMYYQLAYVEWKSGNLRVAVACYLKAIAGSLELRDQASNELRALVTEERQPLMGAAEVNPTLVNAGIPLAPSEEILALLRRASRAAVNEGLVPAAKNMITLQLRYKEDDVLSHVLRSLG